MKIQPPKMEETFKEHKEKMLKTFPPKDKNDIDERAWNVIYLFIITESLYEIEDIELIQPNSKLVIIKLGSGYCDTLVNVYRKRGELYFECLAAKWSELIRFMIKIDPEDNDTNMPDFPLYWKFRTIQDAHFYKGNEERSWENADRLQGCKDGKTFSDGSF